MKKILIPIDFSENAINAINYALALFKDEFCKFYILHAYQEDIYLSNVPITREIIKDCWETQAFMRPRAKDIVESWESLEATRPPPKCASCLVC